MSGVNKVILVGHLGKDPEIRRFEGGTVKASFPLATSESYTNKSGEKVEQTEWHNVVFWGPIADVIEKYLSKGKQVYVEGKIRTRSWDDKDGNKRYTTEINGESMTMLGRKGEGENSSPERFNSPESMTNDSSDDLPF